MPATALAALAALLPSTGCRRPAAADEVPVIEVARTRFTRVVDADGTLKAAQSTPITVPREAEDALRLVWLAVDGSTVKKGDLVARFDDSDFRSRLVAAEEDRTSADTKRTKEVVTAGTGHSDRLRTTVAAERDLQAAKAFERRDAEIFSRDQIIEGEIDERLQAARAEHARGAEHVDDQVAQRKIRVIDVEARKAAEAIRRARHGLSALEVRAPHDGLFVLTRNWRGDPIRVGDNLWPGQPFAELPLVTEMEAEVMVLEVEAAGLVKDRRAEVRLASRPDVVMKAKVKRVDTVARRLLAESPVQYFGVTMTLDKGAPVGMKPRQRVEARLFLDETDALVVPRPALFDRDGRWIVHKRGPAGFTPVVVKLGASTAGRVIVESGLSEHDVIALRDPGQAPDKFLAPASRAGGGAAR